jgi:hypothetical protein
LNGEYQKKKLKQALMLPFIDEEEKEEWRRHPGKLRKGVGEIAMNGR